MIIEPASVHTSSPLRRLLRSAGLVTPVVLLVVAVAAGVLGNRGSPGPDPSSSVPAVAPPSAATATALPRPTLPSTAEAGFPAAYLSMATLLPSEVLTARASAEGPRPLLAVAGYLTVADMPIRCLVAGASPGPWCDRRGILAEAAYTSIGDSLGPPAHLHVIVPAGVVLPPLAANGDPWTPVVVLGRFATAGSCGNDEQACEQGFVVERVVWANGDGTSLEALREPGQGLGLTTAGLGHAETSGIPIVVVLARPVTIARLDPVAGAAAAALPGRPALLWYERQLLWLGSSTPSVSWLLIDPRRGRALASGPSALPPVVTPPASFGVAAP